MKRFFVISISLLLLVLLGQNCGPVHKTYSGSVSGLSLDRDQVFSIKENSPLYSQYPAESLGKDTDLIFLTFARDINEAGLIGVMWDHAMAGGVFCAQKEGANAYQVILNCADAGVLTVFLILEYEDGTIVTHEAEVEILESAVPPPVDPVDPTPVLTGQQLYQISCQGCHAIGSKNRRTATQITSAINGNVGGMGIIDMTAEEIRAVADYLN